MTLEHKSEEISRQRAYVYKSLKQQPAYCSENLCGRGLWGVHTPARDRCALEGMLGFLLGCEGREAAGTFGSCIFVIFLFNSSCSSSSSSASSSSWTQKGEFTKLVLQKVASLNTARRTSATQLMWASPVERNIYYSKIKQHWAMIRNEYFGLYKFVVVNLIILQQTASHSSNLGWIYNLLRFWKFTPWLSFFSVCSFSFSPVANLCNFN